ncbi:MAG: class II aldolase/adducin family protein [Alicyclobacillus herbarius]|uniref:class II aldolase/adducin family protein n=1 Tax=Alicyclobacillus herbarius TaxID=122960 RepID=UPI0023536ED9|nr:class II aldolase/adducin family protein [Alicyclobacillus herbarius]MCL6632462.1 class II aldolase/adducin family protein [Alicyclobacillus herbarius]
MAQSKAEAIRELVLANKILSEEKVLFEAFGHISMRNPENPNEFLLSRSLSASQVEEEDIYTYDMDANCLTPTDKRSFAERVIHSSIYKQRPDVQAICHNHAQELIPFTVLDIPFKPVSHYGAPFYKGVPVYDDYDRFEIPLDVTMNVSGNEDKALMPKKGRRRGALRPSRQPLTIRCRSVGRPRRP